MGDPPCQQDFCSSELQRASWVGRSGAMHGSTGSWMKNSASAPRLSSMRVRATGMGHQRLSADRDVGVWTTCISLIEIVAGHIDPICRPRCRTHGKRLPCRSHQFVTVETAESNTVHTIHMYVWRCTTAPRHMCNRLARKQQYVGAT